MDLPFFLAFPGWPLLTHLSPESEPIEAGEGVLVASEVWGAVIVAQCYFRLTPRVKTSQCQTTESTVTAQAQVSLRFTTLLCVSFSIAPGGKGVGA